MNPALREKTPELARYFATAKPFRHIVIDDFLDPQFCHLLMKEFPAFDSARAVNERGETGRKAVVSEPARLGPAFTRFDQIEEDVLIVGANPSYRKRIRRTGSMTAAGGIVARSVVRRSERSSSRGVWHHKKT